MSELEELDLRIHQVEVWLRSAYDRYHFAATSGGIEERNEALLQCRTLESKIEQLRRERELITGGDDNGKKD